MNPREFREELHNAFIAGIQWALQAPASDDEIKKQGGVPMIISKEANQYATKRIMALPPGKLEPMP